MRLIKVENMLPKSGLGGQAKLEELFFATSQEKTGGKHLV